VASPQRHRHRGSSALTFAELSGYRVEQAGPDFAVDVTAIDLGEVAMWRLRLSPVRATIGEIAPGDLETVQVLSSITGTTTVTIADVAHELPPGSFLLFDPRKPHEFSSPDETTLFLYSVRRSAIEPIIREFPLRVDADPVYSRALRALVTSILDSDTEYSGPGAGNLRIAIESALLASIAEAVGRFRADAGDGGDRFIVLLEGARQIIAREFADRTLTATTLAQRLNVSRSLLHRAFESVGMTPAVELRNARARHAGHLLAEGDSAAQRRSAAKSAGFASVLSMQQAIEALGRD